MTVDNLDERVGVAMHQLPVETLAAIRRGGHIATSLIGQTADLPVPLCIRATLRSDPIRGPAIIMIAEISIRSCECAARCTN